MMTFNESIKTCFKKYFDYSGRATRAEYWWFQLLWWCVTIFCTTTMFAAEDDAVGKFAMVIWLAFFVLTLAPNYCVSVRRLHDTGWSGRTFFWCLLGISIGLIIVNIRNMFPSDYDNEYGRKPFSQKKQKEVQVELSTDATNEDDIDTTSKDDDFTRYMPHSTMPENASESPSIDHTNSTTYAAALQECGPNHIRYCRHCGAKVCNKDAVFCKECGGKL